MPIYEYHCSICDRIFEDLSRLSDGQKRKPCPVCGKRAPRIVSGFAIATGVNGVPYDPVVATQRSGDQRPLCMQNAKIPLSCHMDEYSVKRFAAHALGNGNEFDDKVAKAKEVRRDRGLQEPGYAPATHGHDHSADGSHSHSHAGQNFRRHSQAPGGSRDAPTATASRGKEIPGRLKTRETAVR